MAKNLTPTVIALGYFDSVHKGHQQVIVKAKELADKTCAKTVVFTFAGDLKNALFGKNEGCVYTLNEREKILADLNVDEMFTAPLSKTFLSKGKRAFLNHLNSKYQIIGYVCGKDYRFGKGGTGDAEYLKKYAKQKGQFVQIENLLQSDNLLQGENLLQSDNQKISTTLIKDLLIDGNVKLANQLLGRAYSVTGVVFKDRNVGKKLGFPTINIGTSSEKLSFKKGVYAGHVYINGTKYSTVINYGARPTFNLDSSLLEAHILDFNGDLYGQEVTVYFDYFLREIIKFNTKEELIDRLKQDVDKVRAGQDD